MNKYFWKLFFGDISISGDYKGYFRSSYDKFEKEYPVRIRIFQEFYKISICWETPNSSLSWSINASLEKLSQGNVRLIYTYRNEPTIGTINSSTQNIHYGTAILNIKNGKIDGKYFTSERPVSDSNIQRSNWGIVQAKKIN